ncbi:MAG: transposase [Chitinispirillaceae bacterium]
MPRMHRIQSPGSLAHIMAHCIEGKNLFVDDEDRNEFLSRLGHYLALTGYKCLAWSLMDTHFHLLVRTNHLPMAELMQPLNSGYARYYNKKHKRRGYLFQDRFKSVLCQDQNYAAQLIKYIHLNPLRARMVKSLKQLENWNWCGHGFLMGSETSQGQSFQNREECLRRFGKEEREALENYLKFLSEGLDESNIESAGLLPERESAEIEGSCRGWPAVMGDPEFVRNAMEQHKIGMRRLHRKADYDYVLKKAADEICEKYQISRDDLLQRGRKDIRSDARAEFCYKVRMKELLPASVIADFLRISVSPVAVLVRNGAKIGSNTSV